MSFVREMWQAGQRGAAVGRAWAERREEQRQAQLERQEYLANLDPAGREREQASEVRLAYYKKLFKWLGVGVPMSAAALANEPAVGSLIAVAFGARVAWLVRAQRRREHQARQRAEMAAMIAPLNALRETLAVIPLDELAEDVRPRYAQAIERLATAMGRLGAPTDGVPPQEVLASHPFQAEGIPGMDWNKAHRFFYEVIPCEVLGRLPQMAWSAAVLQRTVAEVQESVDADVEEGHRHAWHVFGYPRPIPGVFDWRRQGPIGLPVRHPVRFQHQVTAGLSGYGKTVALRGDVLQDLSHDFVAVAISHESSFFEERILPYFPAAREANLVYWNPADLRPPIIGIGTFAVERRELLDLAAGEVYTALERAMGDVPKTVPPVLQHAVYALMEVEGSSWATFERLITPSEDAFRRLFVKHADLDDRTRKFWTEYTAATYYHAAFDPIMNRLGAFFRPPLSVTLSTPSFSFHRLLNQEAGVLFCDLSKLRGRAQETVARLIIAAVHQTFAARDYLPQDQWRPAGVHIDEFQRYAPGSQQALEEFLQGMRKYRAYLNAAFQTTANLPLELVRTIFGTVTMLRAFRLSASDARVWAEELRLAEAASGVAGLEAIQEAIQRERQRLADLGAPSSKILESLLSDYRHAQKALMFGEGETPMKTSLRPDLLTTLPIGACIMRGIPSIPGPVSLHVPELPPWLAPQTDKSPQELMEASKHRYGLTPKTSAPHPPQPTPPEEPPAEGRDDEDDDDDDAMFVIRSS